MDTGGAFAPYILVDSRWSPSGTENNADSSALRVVQGTPHLLSADIYMYQNYLGAPGNGEVTVSCRHGYRLMKTEYHLRGGFTQGFKL